MGHALPEALQLLAGAVDAYARGKEEIARQDLLDQYKPLERAVRQLLGPDADGVPLSALPGKLTQLAAKRKAASTQRATGECPPLPKPRKLRGVAITIDGDPALYTEQDTSAYGKNCFIAGTRHGRMSRPNPLEDNPAIQREEDAWSDYRRGAGPKPT